MATHSFHRVRVKMLGSQSLGNGNPHFGVHDANNFCDQRGCMVLEEEICQHCNAPLGAGRVGLCDECADALCSDDNAPKVTDFLP